MKQFRNWTLKASEWIPDCNWSKLYIPLLSLWINHPIFSKLQVQGKLSAVNRVCLFVCFWRESPQWARASLFTILLDHKQRRATVGRTPLYEWSARHRVLYLIIYNTHNRHTSMPPVGFEPTISSSERPQTHMLDPEATGTGGELCVWLKCKNIFLVVNKHSRKGLNYCLIFECRVEA